MNQYRCGELASALRRRLMSQPFAGVHQTPNAAIPLTSVPALDLTLERPEFVAIIMAQLIYVLVRKEGVSFVLRRPLISDWFQVLEHA